MTAPALWEPELLSTCVILCPTLAEYPCEACHLADLPLAQTEYTKGKERYIVCNNERVHHRVWLHDCSNSDDLAFIIPLDSSTELRSAASQRLYRLMMHQYGRSLNRTSAPTNYQQSRLISQLRLLDAEHEGLARRKMAFSILYPNHALMRSLEWKASNERRRFYRMLEEALLLRDSGYRKMLRGHISNRSSLS